MEGGCLCGAVRWRAAGGLSHASHCHCGRCRKSHGTAYGTLAETPEQGFSMRGPVARFETSSGSARCFCPRCGSHLPDDPAGGRRFVPLGGLDVGERGVRPEEHLFVASKAPWFSLTDALPRFDAYPSGDGAPVLPDLAPRDPSGGALRGSCLCGGVAFVVSEPLHLARFCHCSRCRKARAAAFASNGLAAESAVRFTRGGELVAAYKLPEARYFQQNFCRTCGGKLPRLDPERKLAVVPLGALDDDPGVRPREHIFVGSKAPWDEITDALPRHEAAAPA